ncbi:class I SAM-dependent methyltransferase [Chelativorans intermedius]|uniref:Class I SAM-dependent methyltransferase n=1 Tax=Chelativorans intermedius TaxID=515947 RepID=A0ABV6D8B2_9HYPH|nr:class I SAM-dependent methyltransferase [Chelativorans intermedius]MCT8996791.1 class I SAM-dependent methyltransferase [Chelativorans intermedius]
MTALKERIARLIAATGPMSIADYMATCLFDPDHGYYTTREPFGRAGDFITAPEVSQMFGELVAIWLHMAWRACGAPRDAVFVEIGPGRGTLMKDMLRTLARLDAGFAARRFAMVETSPRLTALQQQTLSKSPIRPQWYSRLAEVPEGPLFIVGNELFDALPIRQYVKTATGWRERLVGLDEAGDLAFVAGAGAPDPALLPPEAATCEEGTVFETAPAREAMMETIASRLGTGGGAGLFIDYGHERPALGDTLQAVRRHAYAPVLADPGEADLTAHVDFAALAAVARAHGLAASVMSQGEFLLGLGLVERAGRLGAGRNAAVQERIRGEVERLAGPQAMGTLFKVLAVLPAATAVPPFGP